MHLIGITGRAGTGKDTTADFLVETHGFVKIAFADPLRDGVKAMFGLSDEDLNNRAKKEAQIDWLGCSPRYAMQTLGTDWGREMIHPNLWLNITRRRVDRIMAMSPCQNINGIVISDVRFENEADWIRSMGGRILHISRKQAGLEGGAASHISEQAIPIHLGDHAIINNGDDFEWLYNIVTELVEAM